MICCEPNALAWGLEGKHLVAHGVIQHDVLAERSRYADASAFVCWKVGRSGLADRSETLR